MIDSKLTPSSLEVGNQPRVGSGKIRGAIKQFMDIMVEGLSPSAPRRSKLYDLIVVGGGSVGLAAALEAAGSGLDTLLMERGDGDGTKGAVECICCCPGLATRQQSPGLAEPTGTGGKCFNLDLLPGTEVGSVRDEGEFKVVCSKVVGTEEEQEYRARAILLCPGIRYRRLDVPGEENLMGVDVHHCVSCEGPAYKGQEVVVVGSTDAGFEQTLELAGYAGRVTVLEIRDALTCSKRIADKARNLVNLEVKLNAKVVELKGDHRLESVVVRYVNSGNMEEVKAAAVFVLMGVDPNTEFLRGAIELDPHGYIITDCGLKTNLEGIYAAGDARSSRGADLGEAAEEALAAVLAIRRSLETTENARQS